MINGLIQLIT